MKLIHYGSRVLAHADLRKTTQHREPFQMKPQGLWSSPEHGNDTWRDWCRSEQWGTGGFKRATELVLADESRILRIATSQQLLAFDRAYRKQTERWACPSWIDVAADFHGLLIAPCFSEYRFLLPWYNRWDCASACIWDPRAIVDCVERVDLHDPDMSPIRWEDQDDEQAVTP